MGKFQYCYNLKYDNNSKRLFGKFVINKNDCYVFINYIYLYVTYSINFGIYVGYRTDIDVIMVYNVHSVVCSLRLRLDIQLIIG